MTYILHSLNLNSKHFFSFYTFLFLYLSLFTLPVLSESVDSLWRVRFKQVKLDYPPKSIVIEVFKYPKVMTIYAFNKNKNQYDSIITYPICAMSGDFGPKRKQGDMQVPEGFYCINQFNPHGRFGKSFGINYPNESDKILGKKNNLGGDIYFHGKCCSIGCISFWDDQFYQIYYLVELVHKTQGKIPVLIFPWAMTDWAINKVKKDLPSKDAWFIDFWTNLKTIYDAWKSTKKIPQVNVDRKGKYYFAP